MNKSFLGLAISTLFMVGAAQAEVNPNDVSATLNVTGSVTRQFSCTVNLGASSVNLTGDVSTMSQQGDAGSSNIEIADITLSGDQECSTMAGEGKIAYKFLGTADAADGTSLANNDLSAGAASGVGIALYQVNDGNSVLKINQDTMLAAASPAITHLGLGLVKLNGQELKAGSVQGALTVQIERL